MIASFDQQDAAQRDIQALQIPPGLTNEQVRTWAAACLLAAPFTNAVIRLQDLDTPSAYLSLARTYRLSATEARRDMETVQNWLAFLAPEMLPRGSQRGDGGSRVHRRWSEVACVLSGRLGIFASVLAADWRVARPYCRSVLCCC